MALDPDGGEPTEIAEHLSQATRTLSVHDGELPPPPTPLELCSPTSPVASQSPTSPFASHSPTPDPVAAAAAPEQPDAAHTAASQQPDGQVGGYQPSQDLPSPAVRSVKRATPTTERTESEAADLTRLRVLLDGRSVRDSSSGSSAGRQVPKAAPHQQNWSSSEREGFSSAAGSEADGEHPLGKILAHRRDLPPNFTICGKPNCPQSPASTVMFSYAAT